jgi:hypothetical protein
MFSFSKLTGKRHCLIQVADIVEMVAAMTESELDVASEKTSHNILG